jgi:hypothetical protein
MTVNPTFRYVAPITGPVPGSNVAVTLTTPATVPVAVPVALPVLMMVACPLPATLFTTPQVTGLGKGGVVPSE